MVVKSSQIIHFFLGCFMIFTIPFWGKHPYFWNPPISYQNRESLRIWTAHTWPSTIGWWLLMLVGKPPNSNFIISSKADPSPNFQTKKKENVWKCIIVFCSTDHLPRTQLTAFHIQDSRDETWDFLPKPPPNRHNQTAPSLNGTKRRALRRRPREAHPPFFLEGAM